MTLVEQSPLPSRLSIRTTIEGLVGRPVEITDGTPVPPKTSNVIATYVTDKLQLALIAVVSIEAAAAFGGALGMLPRGGVEDAIQEGELFGLLRENCYEVLNVLSALFNVPDAPHVRLYEMYGPQGLVPPDITAMTAVLGSRLDITVNVTGYGAGLFSFVTR